MGIRVRGGLADGVLDGVDAQVDGTQQSRQFARDRGLAGAGQAREDDEHLSRESCRRGRGGRKAS
jgi:hypothetical protein